MIVLQQCQGFLVHLLEMKQLPSAGCVSIPLLVYTITNRFRNIGSLRKMIFDDTQDVRESPRYLANGQHNVFHTDSDVEHRQAILARGHLLTGERPSNSYSIISDKTIELSPRDAV